MGLFSWLFGQKVDPELERIFREALPEKVMETVAATKRTTTKFTEEQIFNAIMIAVKSRLEYKAGRSVSNKEFTRLMNHCMPTIRETIQAAKK